MKINYGDAFILANAMNDIVVQEVPINAAVFIAEFAGRLQDVIDTFEDKRIEFVKIEDEEEREKQFHAFLSEEVELPDARFSSLVDVKYKATLVLLLKRLNLW